MYRKRDEHTYWYNEKPIATTHEALDALRKRWGDSGKRYIYTDGEKPELRIGWYKEGSSGGDSAGTDYFEIKPEVAAELAKLGYIEKMPIREIGYTYREPHKFVLSREGERELERLYKEKKEVARSLLVPGEHSQFSSIFDDAGSDREGYRHCGRLFFDFVTPMKEKVRVYPDTKEVEKLEPEKA